MNNTPKFTAVLSSRCATPGTLPADARWTLTVAICPGRVSTWPSTAWPGGRHTPTVAERATRLAEFGFGIAPDDEWTWTEDVCGVHDDASPHVTLLAAVPVQRHGGAR
ncbi:DUF6303 family protein [Streptomyces sp. NPDC049879]|uniref:DUF6303 family protein n=1 Tax=Streptomyces sp. NPDC049879 TaxID=3365598 RepID=UPI0037B151DA